MSDDTYTGDEWQDANLMYTSDPATCLVCATEIAAWPEGFKHADESLTTLTVAGDGRLTLEQAAHPYENEWGRTTARWMGTPRGCSPTLKRDYGPV